MHTGDTGTGEHRHLPPQSLGDGYLNKSILGTEARVSGWRAHIHRTNVLSWPGLVTVQVEPITLRALSKVAEPGAKLPRGPIDILQAHGTIFRSGLLPQRLLIPPQIPWPPVCSTAVVVGRREPQPHTGHQALPSGRDKHCTPTPGGGEGETGGIRLPVTELQLQSLNSQSSK